jgi:hypothetical protein
VDQFSGSGQNRRSGGQKIATQSNHARPSQPFVSAHEFSKIFHFAQTLLRPAAVLAPHLPWAVGLLGFAPDLLDANESTWAFVDVDSVGSGEKPQLRRLESLAVEDRYRSYCLRTADAALFCSPEREGAGLFKATADCGRGHPTLLD